VLAHHPEVTGQGEFEAAAGRDTIDGRDHRHLDALDEVEHVVDLAGNRPEAARPDLGQAGHAGHVLAGRERPARPGDDEHPQVGFAGGRLDGIPELPAHGAMPGVELLRPVEREDPDPVAAIRLADDRLLHRAAAHPTVMTTAVATTAPSGLCSATP